MRGFFPCAGAILLLSMACAQAHTTPAEPSESVNGVNVKAPAGPAIPPAPDLAPIHQGVVAATVDSLPAAQHEKMREQNMIEEQNRVAAASPEPVPHAATISPKQASRPRPAAVADHAAPAVPAKNSDHGPYRGM